MANKDAHIDNFWGCHIDVLNIVNSKFDGKDKFMLTYGTNLKLF